jgi:hypothetical protein
MPLKEFYIRLRDFSVLVFHYSHRSLHPRRSFGAFAEIIYPFPRRPTKIAKNKMQLLASTLIMLSLLVINTQALVKTHPSRRSTGTTN